MSLLEQYRPPGRSNRSGRSQADNDVFEGLPVKQWNQSFSRVSLAPPVSESQNPEDQKWADPPMPRDYQLLNPWTQQLLRLARSGKVGTKRKQDPDAVDDDKPEDEVAEEASKNHVDERGYIAKKWRQVPEHLLEPEHKHFEFLAKRRRGLPSLYGPEVQNGANIAMRKTKVQRTGADGEVAVYEVLVPEGQAIEGEVAESTELAEVKPVVAAPGTAIEGLGIANEEGVLVAEHLKPAVAPRRNRPPPKKKGGPGRGKKRVTFTNPDGSTYTTVVPNATKIVPQPGQTVKHVAKGEEASADVTAEQAAAHQTPNPEGEEGSGSDDGEDDGDDDDDREEGELSEDDAPGTGVDTPAKPNTPAKTATPAPPAQVDESDPMEDVKPTDPAPAEPTEAAKEDEPKAENVTGETELSAAETEPVVEDKKDASEEPSSVEPQADEQPSEPAPAPEPVSAPTEDVEIRDASSSPELPLAKTSHSRSGSLADPPPVSLDEHAPPPESEPAEEANVEAVAEAEVDTEEAKEAEAPKEPRPAAVEEPTPAATEEPEKADDGEDDLLGNLEKHLGGEKEDEDA
ncbi:hypothetical protein M409DRAFT_70583 [Zasmidium cellare ATCC 36951]|uniref:Uncharacterized protein n=1 Tax=Zasmidium cellare ATCC 36951 TaxID=1080233 RepID=A0A6A6C2Y3_ZASCE|nr:uncharacterized protein M409DRAFT_70583 [Zasmidium cellare ATCC 36951]KAF2160232.1 hypothetical protein M409DRAFT_70583 [Zasmidium cellare ATCC 36951]